MLQRQRVNGRKTRFCARGVAYAAWVGTALVAGRAQAQWSSVALGGMDVEVFAPEAASPVGTGRALMLVLHGCAQRATGLRDDGNLEAAADSLGVVMALPHVPGGGVVAGCWDYYGSAHTRDSRHNGPVLAMVEALLRDPSLSIDPEQVYVVGFSSGAGEALVLGCLAPDVFAGVGVVAGPGLGTAVSQTAVVSTTPEDAQALCIQLAGQQAPALDTQVAFTFADVNDFTVSTGYNTLNAQMFGLVYAQGLDSLRAESFELLRLPGIAPAGTGVTYADGRGVRIAQLDSTTGAGHAWPSGSGQVGAPLGFIDGDGLNLSMFAAEFFANNNARLRDPEPPPGDTESSSTDGDSSQESGEDTTAQTGGTTGASQSTSTSAGEGGEASGTGAPESTGAATQQGSAASGCSVGTGSGRRSLAFFALLLGLRRRRT